MPTHHPLLPHQRGSVRNVTIEGDPRTYMCEVRTQTGSGLRDGDRCWVEFGASWSTLRGRDIRHGGKWRECVVLKGPAGTAADVHVRIIGTQHGIAQRLEQQRCWCWEGWVCEDHPDQPVNHDDCGGAGMPCPRH